MLETWSPSDIIALTVILLTLGAPFVYGWADRWLDRSRNSISDSVKDKSD